MTFDRDAASQPCKKGSSMKKVEGERCTEYKRSDFTTLERGEFHEVAKG
jgi:hypothetical protein